MIEYQPFHPSHSEYATQLKDRVISAHSRFRSGSSEKHQHAQQGRAA